MTSNWKVNNHKNIIACPHSTIRFWDLRYYHSKDTLDLEIDNKLPITDFIATNGQDAFNKFLEIGYPRDKLVKVEALRYMYLNEIEKIFNHTGPKIRTIRGDIVSWYGSRALLAFDYFDKEFADL